MTKEEKVQHWVKMSERDIDAAEWNLEGKYNLIVGYLCHQAVEKIFKANFVKINDETPPFIHNLFRLAELTELFEKMSNEQKDFLIELNPLYIKTRYDEYKNIIEKKNDRRSNPKNPFAIKGDHRMDKRDDVIRVAKKYADFVKASNLPMKIESAYLFGSYAKGTPHKDSDIDIAFIVSNWTGDYDNTIKPVWGMTIQFDTRIEPHIIDPEHDYSYFEQEIQRTGIELC